MQPYISPLLHPIHLHPLFSLICNYRHFNIQTAFLPSLISERITKLLQWSLQKCICLVAVLQNWKGEDLVDMVFGGRLLVPQAAVVRRVRQQRPSQGTLDLGHVSATPAGSKGSSHSTNNSCPHATVASRLLCSHFTFSFSFLSLFHCYSFIKSVFQWELCARHFHWPFRACIC